MTATLRRPAAAPRTGTRHLWQVDVVRILTFGCVIAVHATAQVNVGTSVSAGAVLMLLHFTREVFFLVTGFVLVHSQGRGPLPVTAFWRHRFLLVGLPYVVWSAVYFVVNHGGNWTGDWPEQFALVLLTGTACYHLYFLLVSLQIYVVFPLLRALLRRTEGRHGWLLAGALMWQIGVTALLQYGGLGGTALGEYADAMLPSYLGYLVAGGLAAWHLARWQQWVSAHPRLIVGALVASAGVALGAFTAQLHGPGSVGPAQAVLQPAMLPWSLAVGAALYAFGSWWARPGAARRLRPAVAVGSRISFGVYLVHPLVLEWFNGHGFGQRGLVLPAVPATVVLWFFAAALSALAVLALQRSPLSLPLTGRRREPQRTRAAVLAGV